MFDSMGVVADNGWEAGAREWFAANADAQGVRIVVAESAGAVVACGMVTLQVTAPSPRSPGGVSAYVANIATLPEARGQGCAGRILDALLDWARSAGADRAELHATEAGRPIYERAGFRDTAVPSMRVAL